MDIDSFLEETESIKILLKELQSEQQTAIKNETEKYKTLMQRINKLQEFNEISEMRYQYLYNEMIKIKEKLDVIY